MRPLTVLPGRVVGSTPYAKDGALTLVLLLLFVLPPLTPLGDCWETRCEDLNLLGWFLAVLSVGPLALKHRFPLSVLAALTLGQFSWALLDYATHRVQSLPILVGIYAVATSAHRLPVRLLALAPPSLFIGVAAILGGAELLKVLCSVDSAAPWSVSSAGPVGPATDELCIAIHEIGRLARVHRGRAMDEHVKAEAG